MEGTLASVAGDGRALSPQATTSHVHKLLLGDPSRMGVMLRHEGEARAVAVIGRDLLWRMLTRPFFREVFLRRPILDLVTRISPTLLRLPADTPLSTAVSQAMARPAELIYEPLLVVDAAGAESLVSFADLLLAQAKAAQTLAQQAAQAAEAKARFLSHMSHELRTPMTAILGYADLLMEETCDEPTRRDYLGVVQRNGRHLLSLLNDVLDQAKLEAGSMPVEDLDTPLHTLILDTVSLIRPQAQTKGLTLITRIDPSVPPCAGTDPRRLKQILLNLLTNALKFTHEGTIRVEAWMQANEPQPATLCISIADEGIGIPPEAMQRMFKPFEQADASTARRFGGTGLGLCISRALALRLGGDITVQSEPGRGSTFTVSITPRPIRNNPAKSAPQAPAANLPLKGHVLLVEDGLDNQRLISHLLRKWGLSVVIASDGIEALETVAAPASEPFDLILMDTQMPRLDGHAATSRLRAAGFHRPIIALSAHALPEERHRCMTSGCDAWLGKPIDRTAMHATLTHWLNPTAAGQVAQRE